MRSIQRSKPTLQSKSHFVMSLFFLKKGDPAWSHTDSPGEVKAAVMDLHPVLGLGSQRLPVHYKLHLSSTTQTDYHTPIWGNIRKRTIFKNSFVYHNS